MTMDKEYHKEYFRKYRIKNREKLDQYNKDWHRNNFERKKENSERWKLNNPFKQIFITKKSNAKTRGVEFTIEFEDIEFPKYCPVFNFELDYSYGRKTIKKNSPSFDRIDPSKGYVKDNVRIISQLANAMKQDATVDELKQFANYILGDNYE